MLDSWKLIFIFNFFCVLCQSNGLIFITRFLHDHRIIAFSLTETDTMRYKLANPVLGMDVFWEVVMQPNLVNEIAYEWKCRKWNLQNGAWKASDIPRFPRHWQPMTSVIRKSDRTHVVTEIKMNRCGDIIYTHTLKVVSRYEFYICSIFYIINCFYADKLVKSNDLINKINISLRACLVSSLQLTLNKEYNFVMKKCK